MCVLSNSAGLICYLKVQENLFLPLQLLFLWYTHLTASLYCMKWNCLLSRICLCDFRTVQYILVCHASVLCGMFIAVPFPWIFFICPLKYILILCWATVWYLMVPRSTELCTKTWISKLQLSYFRYYVNPPSLHPVWIAYHLGNQVRIFGILTRQQDGQGRDRVLVGARGFSVFQTSRLGLGAIWPIQWVLRGTLLGSKEARAWGWGWPLTSLYCRG